MNVHTMERGRWSLRRGGLIAVVACALVGPFLFSSAAHADPPVAISSDPADSSTVPTSPVAITVTFDQTIGSAASAVIACNGNFANNPAPRVAEDLRSLVVDLSGTPLPKGQCQVTWTVQGTATPGTNTGHFSFTVAQDTVITQAPVGTTPTAGSTVTATTTPTDSTADSSGAPKVGGPLGLARLLSTLSIAVLFGSLVLITVAWPEGIEYILTIRFLRYSWVIGVVTTAFLVVCLTAQATGKGIGGSLNPTSWFDLKDTTPGIAALARLGLIAVSGWVAMRPERCIDPATQLPALALPGLAVATLGFDRTGGRLELIGYVSGVGHAIGMAVWIGGLILLARVVLAGPGEDDLVHAVRGFGRIATPALLLTVITGAIQLYRLDAGHLFDTTHGRLVLLKIVPVVAMIFVGVATRQFAHANLARADVMTAPMAGRLRRAVGMEAAIGVLVLAITAWMMSAQPGNLVAQPRSSNDFAYQQSFADPSGKLEMKLSVNPAQVGRNEVLIEVQKPVSGISSITVEFVPPAGSNANPVRMTVTNLPGIGGAYLPIDQGVPLNASGVWNLSIDVVSSDGTFHQTGNLPIATTNEDDSIPPITTLPAPIVTSPPTTATTIAQTATTG